MPTRCAISWGWPRCAPHLGSPGQESASTWARSSYVLQVWDKTAGAWVNDGAPTRTSTGVRLRVWHAGDSAGQHPGRYRALATLHHGSDGGRGDRQHILHQLQLARTAGRCRRVALSTARVLPAQRDWGFRDHGHVDTAHQVLVVAKWHCGLETAVRAT